MAGIEARGFILAAPVALPSWVPASCRCARRASCPAATYARGLPLEYGTATLEVHTDAFDPGERVLIVDDVLATGGTAAAAAELVRRGRRRRWPASSSCSSWASWTAAPGWAEPPLHALLTV